MCGVNQLTAVRQLIHRSKTRVALSITGNPSSILKTETRFQNDKDNIAKMSSTDRSSCWSVTINNPTSADEEEIATARQRGWTVEGQKERGESGTEHYQLMVRTPQVRFSAVKRAFTRAHIEPARNQAALAVYVKKAQTRTGELSVSQTRYPTLKRYWEMVLAELSKLNWVNWSDGGWFENADEMWFKDCPRNLRTRPLAILDFVTERLIREGYFVEQWATNPQIRSQFDKFHRAILCRAYADSQTDRQDSGPESPEENVAVVNIPTAHALQSSFEESSERLLGQVVRQEGSTQGRASHEAGDEDSSESTCEASS